jgi:hypothetical protein
VRFIQFSPVTTTFSEEKDSDELTKLYNKKKEEEEEKPEAVLKLSQEIKAWADCGDSYTTVYNRGYPEIWAAASTVITFSYDDDANHSSSLFPCWFLLYRGSPPFL